MMNEDEIRKRNAACRMEELDRLNLPDSWKPLVWEYDVYMVTPLFRKGHSVEDARYILNETEYKEFKLLKKRSPKSYRVTRRKTRFLNT